jgi:hypothetical protein
MSGEEDQNAYDELVIQTREFLAEFVTSLLGMTEDKYEDEALEREFILRAMNRLCIILIMGVDRANQAGADVSSICFHRECVMQDPEEDEEDIDMHPEWN